jgi:hypothetical protein
LTYKQIFFYIADWSSEKYGYSRYGPGMQLPGSLTPPDKLNGDHCTPLAPPGSHWGPSTLGINSMAGPMQTPPSSPPMTVDRFGYVKNFPGFLKIILDS